MAYLLSTQWGSSGAEDGQFSGVVGVAVDADEVFIADTLNHRIQVFRPNGVYLRQWGIFGSDDGQFDSPRAIAIAHGRVYVSDQKNNRIQVFDRYGKFIQKWGTFGVLDGQFNNPDSISIAHDRVFVADNGSDRVQVFDLYGNFLYKWGVSGTGESQINEMRGLSVHAGRVYITDRLLAGDDRVKVFSLDGVFLFKWGKDGTGPGEFHVPFYIHASPVGVFVTDNTNARVQRFTLEGDFVESFGGFTDVVGVFHDGSRLFVTDRGSNSVRVFVDSLVQSPSSSTIRRRYEDLASIRGRLLNITGRYDLGEEANTFINDAQEYLDTLLELPESIATYSHVLGIGDDRFIAKHRFINVTRLLIIDNGDSIRDLTFRGFIPYDAWYIEVPTVSSGTPSAWTMNRDDHRDLTEFLFNAKADSSCEVRVSGRVLTPPLLEDSDVSMWTMKYPGLLAKTAAYLLEKTYGDTSRLRYWREVLDDEIHIIDNAAVDFSLSGVPMRINA